MRESFFRARDAVDTETRAAFATSCNAQHVYPAKSLASAPHD